MRLWTDTEIARALKLRSGGMSAREIGLQLDRSEASIRDRFFRIDHNEHCRNVGQPIGQTQEDRHFANDAVRGSERLLAEIERVFGRRAA